MNSTIFDSNYTKCNVCLLIALIFSAPGRPEVYVFVRKVPEDQSKLNLTCLTTGFYPKNTEMNIRLDRTVLGKQIFSEIRPNADETFQIRSSVKIDRNHKGSYDCFVIHSSLTEPVSVEWGKYHQKYSHSHIRNRRT